ncbi:unnamed protein product [Rhizoctonia solani]|uniref:DNA polymerase eta n=1 Tax=Rhizoctonia solani TaxID=456999 RepID=A0A8H2ZZ09_9AGAM|nr:unnamed protein product [Rhizoctonia solani]CAE6466330.1 unnamed protein product [Rhizoctonia solani]
MAPPSPSRPKSICTDKISAYSYNPMRVIALCDNDAFYASCERVRLDVDPEQPLVVQQWTNLIAVNYPARKFGITRHESIVDARKKCPNLMAVHVATYREGDSEPQYWEDPSPTTHKVSLDHYRRESARVFQLFQDMMPAGGEMEKASIDEVFIDYTIPVRFLMLERYPQLRIPDGPFDLDTPLPVPPAHIDWAGLSTYIIPVTSDSPADNDATSRPITPSLTTEMALNSTDDMLVSLPIPTSPDPSPTDLTAVGSDAPPTWHDVALSIAAELMRDIRQTTFEKLGYTLSAGIARNKMLAKLSASYRKPMAQSVLRNVAIPGYLGPMPFQKIRFLGGKLGDAMATQFGATTVSELREIELEDMQRRCGEESIWVWNVLRGIDYSEVKERTALKSMMASKNVRPAITTTEQARHWLAVLSAELAVRLTDARKVNATVWPRTLVLHIRQGSNAPRSKQTAFPFARAFSAATILAPAEKLWRTLLPGTGDLSAGVINVALGFAGLDALEAGQKGIEGFFGTKGLNSSTKKAATSINGPMAAKSESLAPGSKARRTSSPAITDNKHQGKEHSSNLKRDFFNGAASNKRKAIVHEVLDDSSSDVVEISPPPTAKRVNSGSSGQAEPRSLTPTPISRDTKQRKPGSNDKDKAKNEKNAKAASKGTADIANFFAPRPGVTGAKTKGKK